MPGGVPLRVCLEGFIEESVWRGSLESMSGEFHWRVFLEGLLKNMYGGGLLENMSGGVY